MKGGKRIHKYEQKKNVSRKKNGIDNSFAKKIYGKFDYNKVMRQLDEQIAEFSSVHATLDFQLPYSIHAKFEVSQPGDASEIQADEMADSFMRGDTEHSQNIFSQQGPQVSRIGEGGEMQTSNEFDQQLQSTKGQGQKLDDETKAELEEHMGQDLSNVNIHNNPDANEMADNIRAKAFATGNDIYFNEGEFDTKTDEGRRLLAHEVTHTVQANSGMMMPKLFFTRQDDLIEELNSAIAVNDKPQYMDSLRKDMAALAEDPAVYTEISKHYSATSITLNEAWQAILILNYGDDTDLPHPWPITIKNFFEGIITGVYTAPLSMPPRTKDEILGMAISISHQTITTAIGSGRKGPFIDYQGRFNALWGQSAYAAIPNAYDNTLDSKGPRTQKARAIFDHLYTTDAKVKSDYDADVKAIGNETYKMRALVDQYVGPESINMIASPRLQLLRKLFFDQAKIYSTKISENPADPYNVFIRTIKTAAENLDEYDRQEILSSQEWRIIIEKTINNKTMQEATTEYLQGAFLDKTGGAAPGILGVGTKKSTLSNTNTNTNTNTSVTNTHTALTLPQQAFVDDLALIAITASPLIVADEKATMIFQAIGSLGPSGLTDFETVVSVTPVRHLQGSSITSEAWPGASYSSKKHKSIVYTEKGSGSRTYTASLRLQYTDGTEIKPTVPYKTEIVDVQDDRENVFKNNMYYSFLSYTENKTNRYSPGSAASIEYFGKLAPISINAAFKSGVTNPPGLTININGSLTQNGTTVWSTKTPAKMYGGVSNKHVGDYTIKQKLPPDKMVLKLDFHNAVDGNKLIHTITENFDVLQESNTTPMSTRMANLQSQLRADHATLQVYTPITDPRPAKGHSFIDDMLYHGNAQQARVAEAIIAGKITVEPAIMRPDSTTYINALIKDINLNSSYATMRAFALAQHPADVSPNYENTAFMNPGPSGFHYPTKKWMNTIFVIYTKSLDPLIQSPDWSGPISTLTHESVHMIDVRPNSESDLERYKSEFRAYWMDGNRDHLSSEFNPALDSFGPKSQKARNIFKHLYENEKAYGYTKKNYDANTDGFRDKVNAFIVPDGINMIVSVRIDDLREKVTKLPSAVAYKGTKNQTNIQAEYAKLNVDDKREVSGNRYWRDLVESKKYSVSDTIELKKDLLIPY